jgi:hypothetical protein
MKKTTEVKDLNNNNTLDAFLAVNSQAIAPVLPVQPQPKKPSANASSSARDRFKKPNYCKYELIKNQMIPRLNGTETSAVLAKDLGLSITTFHKYKSLAASMAEPGYTLLTLEEKIYKDKHPK